MMSSGLKILSNDYLEGYTAQISVAFSEALKKLQLKAGFSKDDFEFYIQTSATYSSNIEGNSIDVDTYLKNKRFNIKSKPKEMAEIDDLIFAYNFAMQTELSQDTFLEAHKILSNTILSLKSQRGKLRKQQVGIFSNGKVEYMAAEPGDVKDEVAKLFHDITLLLASDLSQPEVFYYAAMIHLIFEKIHPFLDGNGRAGRLLEKWFLAVKLGENAWSIPSEQYYARHKADYYEKIHIGYNYYTLKMERFLPFLLLLPNALVEGR